MAVRAKFVCMKVEGTGAPVTVQLMAVTDDGTPENERWHQYTPNGLLSMSIDNPAASSQFVEGKEYFVDINEAK